MIPNSITSLLKKKASDMMPPDFDFGSQEEEEKESNISEDELKKNIDNIQKITDENIERIEKILEIKRSDILKV